MKSALVVCSVAIMLSCSSFFRDSTRPVGMAASSPTIPACKKCPRQEAMTILFEDLEQCEAQVVTLTKTTVKVKEVPVDRVVVRTEKRKCADDGPTIQPVPSSKCQSGQLCLDDEGQRILAKNMAAYEAWVTHVKDCEAR